MVLGLQDIIGARDVSHDLVVADMTKLFWVIAGEKQVGKSTFTSRFPDPFYLDYEHRLDSIVMPNGQRPPQKKIYEWNEGYQWVEAFIGTKPEETGIQTIVLDGGGAVAFKMLKQTILGTSTKKAKGLNDEDLGFNKGWEWAGDEYTKFIMNLRRLKEQGYGIVLTTHDRIVPFTNNGADFDKKAPMISDDKAEKFGWNAIKAFPDVVVHVSKQRTPKGVEHIARLRGNDLVEAGFPSKPDGTLMPETLPFSFAAFREAWDQTGS